MSDVSFQIKTEVRCVLDARDALGESPVWCPKERVLYRVDILGQKILRWNPNTGEQQSWRMPAKIGSLGLCLDGRLIVALKGGVHLFNTRRETMECIATPDAHIATNRLNDGKVSPEGRFWIGSMDDRPEKHEVASLFCISGNNRCVAVVGGLKVSNGLAWSPDGRIMYHSDSRAATVWRYTYDPATGQLADKAVFISYHPEWGRPDGAAVDVDGCYWSAGVSAGRINRFDAAGQLMGFVQTPISHPTMVCFGGADMKTVYVTSVRADLPSELLESTPLAGGVFAFESGVAGVPVGVFAEARQ